MATKIKKGYDQMANGNKPKKSSQEDQKNSDLPARERPILAGVPVEAAPIWRRLAAYGFDLVLSLSMTALMMYSANIPGTPQEQSILMLFSALIIQLWLFGFLPGEYTPGQTLGQKIFGIYVRRRDNQKALGTWRNMLRGYVYGVIGSPMSIPFEIIALAFQFFTEKPSTTKTLQNLPISHKQLTLPRDFLFNVEVVRAKKA